ncbi:MAG: DUF2079 domain-containing protein [Deltaproteobacteria bacterium]|nr:DUF2079 domain-containing protein [Deltaproteobacteria bacterium]
MGGGWQQALRRGAIALALCYGVGALATQAALAREFSHTPDFVARLGRLAWLPWLFAVALALWLFALQRAHRGRGRVLLDGASIERSAPLLWPCALLAIAPCMSAYASHAVLPALALCGGLLGLASLELAPAAIARGRELLGHRAAPFVVAGMAAAWFFAVSFYRHANFGSGSRDMGLFFQTVFLLSRGRPPINTVMDIASPEHAINAFADHMEFIDLLLVPLVWIWRDAGALLLAQALVTGSGVAAVMRLAQRRTGDGLAALAFGLSYFLAYPIAGGVQFDWNPTTMSIGLFAWAFDFADRRRYRGLIATLVLIALCKENLLLYVAAFGLYLLLDGHGVKLGGGVLAAALLLFGVELKLLFPIFRSGGFRHFYFRELGDSFGQVALNLAASPLRAAIQLVTPGNKVDGLFIPFSSTAWLCLAAPAPLIVALPAVGERFLGDFRNAWWGHHYGGPTAAIAICAAVIGSARLLPWLGPLVWRRLPGAAAATALGLACLCATLLVDVAGRWSPTDLFVLEKPYLPPPAERAGMRAAVRAVPPDVSVAAQNYFLAHLADRDRIYELALSERAEVVVLNPTTNPWPYSGDHVRQLARRLAQRGDYALVFCAGHSWVFRRGADPAQAPQCPTLDELRGGSQ